MNGCSMIAKAKGRLALRCFALALGCLFVVPSALAMLSDEDAIRAARETLAKMTLEEKNMLLGGRVR